MHYSICRSGIAAALLLGVFAVHADEGVEQSGKARYLERCSVCHGAGGKGDGPFAPMMTSKPANLTLLAKNNKGEFPFGHAYDTVDGRNILLAHGTRDMPIWGKELKRAGLGGETDLRGQLVETLIFLRTIQVP